MKNFFISILYFDGKYNFSNDLGKLFNSLSYLLLLIDIIFIEEGKFDNSKLKLSNKCNSTIH